MPISGALQQMCLLLNTDTNTWELKPIKKWEKKKKKEHHCMPLQQQTVRPLVELLKGHWSKWVKLTSPAKSFPSARLHYSFHNCNQMCRLPHTVLLAANLPMLALTSHLENRSLNFKEPWARLARYITGVQTNKSSRAVEFGRVQEHGKTLQATKGGQCFSCSSVREMGHLAN